MKNSEKVVRHSLAVRLVHWLVAISGLLLIFTGMGELPMYKRYNLVKLPGLGWAGDFELNLILHYGTAVVFGAAVCFHLVYHLRRRELAAWPQKGDFRESLSIIKALLSGGEEPPHGKFLAEQRLAYAATGAVSLLLLLTGLLKSYKNLGAIVIDPSILQVVTVLHTVGTMVFMLLIIAHVGAFALRANWPLLPTMLTGAVNRDYARRRHRKWRI
ncbi:cytochrome b/b6 domain-containing protein [uncultured Desulfuromonas sp.]|nr:cytochrome b/b6 domain-containing protein [uncultured Desulfuromonas sp.]